MQTEPICFNCKNYNGGSKCKAFTKIPDNILYGITMHSEPTKNQKNDIVYEPIK